MTREKDPRKEEQAVVDALELLDRGAFPAFGGAEPPDEDLAAYLEAWGRLPEALDLEAPPAGLKESLLARALETAQETPRGPAEESAQTVPFRRPGADAPRWLLPLAAALALAVLGLSVFTFSLSRRLGLQESELLAYTQPTPLGHMEAELKPAEYTFPDLQSRLGGEPAEGSRYFVLTSPGDPDVRGGMFACGMHKQWVLRIHGLPAAAPGEEVHLWFVTERGPVHVGAMEFLEDGVAQASAGYLPSTVKGIQVTRESAREVGTAPGGPVLAEAKQGLRI